MGPALLTRLFNIQGDMVAGTDGQMVHGIAFFFPLPSPLIHSYPITFPATKPFQGVSSPVTHTHFRSYVIEP
jgi:hypothetical protein